MEEFKKKRDKINNESTQQKPLLNSQPSNRNRKDSLLHILVHVHLRTKVSTMIRTLELNLLILRVIWHKRVVILLHARSFVGYIQVLVVKGPLVLSSLVIIAPRRTTSCTDGGTNHLYSSNSVQDQHDCCH